MIELRHLRSLLAIADTGKMATAAERVHLTQSALSHQVRALEAHYGLKLMQRTSQGLRFTPAGERLVELARQVLGQVADAQRDLMRLAGDTRGELRIALECHTCFDWLMPVMNEFRRRWPEVELDLVAGFHSEPMSLLAQGKCELVVGSAPDRLPRRIASWPLFRYEIQAVLPNEHRLRHRRRLEAEDFAGETLITYPVPEERIDVIREVLRPARVAFKRRTAELTVAILQLVASRRGIAALPSWGVKSYVDYGHVIAKRIGSQGLWSDLYAIAPESIVERPYVHELVNIMREQCQKQLPLIDLL